METWDACTSSSSLLLCFNEAITIRLWRPQIFIERFLGGSNAFNEAITIRLWRRSTRTSSKRRLSLSFNEAITIRLWRQTIAKINHSISVDLQRSHNHSVMETRIRRRYSFVKVILQRSHNHSVMETVYANQIIYASQIPSTKP